MDSLQAVEMIVKHKFKNKSLLKEALTRYPSLESPSNKRLEFLGDSALDLAITKHIYLTYPNLGPDEMTPLRVANVSNEKFARVAIKHGLYRFIQHDTVPTDKIVKEFSEAVSKEDDTVIYGGLVKAPKILADLVEAIAGAIYIDVNFDLQRFWMIIKGLLEPIVAFDQIQRQPEPITRLYGFCHKQKKQIDFRFCKEGTSRIAQVYLDDELFASGNAAHRDIAKLFAAKEALRKLSGCVEMDIDEEDSPVVETEDAKGKNILQLQTASSSFPIDLGSENSLSYETTPETLVIDVDEDCQLVQPEDAKGELFVFCATKKPEKRYPLTYEMTQSKMAIDEVEDSLQVTPKMKLNQICAMKKWPNPIYSTERVKRPEKVFVCTVKIEIPTAEGTFCMKGDIKQKPTQAESSAAYHMLRVLKTSFLAHVVGSLELETKKSLEEKKKLINIEKHNLILQQSLEKRKLFEQKFFKKEKILEEAGLLRRSKRIKSMNV